MYFFFTGYTRRAGNGATTTAERFTRNRRARSSVHKCYYLFIECNNWRPPWTDTGCAPAKRTVTDEARKMSNRRARGGGGRCVRRLWTRRRAWRHIVTPPPPTPRPTPELFSEAGTHGREPTTTPVALVSRTRLSIQFIVSLTGLRWYVYYIKINIVCLFVGYFFFFILLMIIKRAYLSR